MYALCCWCMGEGKVNGTMKMSSKMDRSITSVTHILNPDYAGDFVVADT